MIEIFGGVNPILQALLTALFTLGAALLGA
jgi:hypothetical protein